MLVGLWLVGCLGGQISKENAVKVVVKQPEGVKLVKNVSWRYIDRKSVV